LTFYILSKSLTQPDVAEGHWDVKTGKTIFGILQYVYLTILLVQLLLAMGNRPREYLFIFFYYKFFYLFFLIMCTVLFNLTINYTLIITVQDGHIFFQ
jgi:chitin synthase